MEIGLPLAGIIFISESAFSYKSRREIGNRDKWECQYDGCDDGEGRPKSFKNGWMVFASHIGTHDKKDPDYDNPDNGRIQCIEHEIAFHNELLQDAIQSEDKRQIRFNEMALEKLSHVDHRTYAYRKEEKGMMV